MDSLMTHFIPALIVIAYYMTSNSARALETRGGKKNPLEVQTYEIKARFSISRPTRFEQLNGCNPLLYNKT